jgi:PKD repeat protein
VDGRAPTDPDGDGLYEDVDGDGVADLDDVFDLAFADHAAVNAVPARREALDFDGSGVVDLDDAFELAFAD